jgi:hypothetical protein
MTGHIRLLAVAAPAALADLPVPLVVAVVVGLSLLVVVMTRRRLGRVTPTAPRRRHDAPASAAGSSASRRDVHEGMRELMLELEQLSREVNSQVDTRLRALNLLVQEADQKIKELRLLQGRQGGPGPSRHLPPPREAPHPEETDARYARVYELASAGRSVVEIAREMEMMTGEVELILALRRTAAQPGETA